MAEDDPSKIGIMVCGKTGIGKSTLLNTLFGTKDRKFFVNGPGGDGENRMEAGTKHLISVTEKIHDVEVTIYDTPGLRSGQCDQHYIDLIAGEMEGVDLILFCVDGVSNRWDAAEAEIVRKLHAAFGNEFWMNAIFVITRSNMMQYALADENDEVLEPEKKIAVCGKAARDIFGALKKQLQEELNASPDVVQGIPLVAAGGLSLKSRKLHFVAEKAYEVDFLPELWSLAVERCKYQKRPLFFLVSNFEQQRFKLLDESATLSLDERDLMTQAQEICNATIPSGPLNGITDMIPQPEPIVLSEQQSNRVVEALAASFLHRIGLGAGDTNTFDMDAISYIIQTGLSAVLVSTFVGMRVAGPVGAGVGAVGVLIVILINQYKKMKKRSVCRMASN